MPLISTFVALLETLGAQSLGCGVMLLVPFGVIVVVWTSLKRRDVLIVVGAG